MEQNEIIKLLEAAKEEFLRKDSDLLTIGVNERSLTHKFAEYLQRSLEDIFNVDCEYNRFGNKPKVIDQIQSIIGDTVNTSDHESKTVYPDIIIHKRGPEGPNVVVIEAKKNPTTGQEEDDKQKLILLKTEYGYSFGVFLKFYTSTKSIEWEFV